MRDPEAARERTVQSLIASRVRLERLSRKRARELPRLVREVLASGSAEAVHDLRVCSRRVQQIVELLYDKPYRGSVRRLRRRLRRLRNRLGEWRNLDVILERLHRKILASRSPHERWAWNIIRRDIAERRLEEVARARRWLRRQPVRHWSDRLRGAFDRAWKRARGREPATRAARGLREARIEWRKSFVRARARSAVDRIHALRIATKRLRYRMELAHALGHEHAGKALERLQEIQQKFGEWNDHQVFHPIVLEHVGRSRILFRDLDAARLVLRDIEREVEDDAAAVKSLLALALKRSKEDQSGS